MAEKNEPNSQGFRKLKSIALAYRSALVELESQLDKCQSKHEEDKLGDTIGDFINLQNSNPKFFWKSLHEAGVTESDVFHLEYYIQANLTKSPTINKRFILRDKVIQLYIEQVRKEHSQMSEHFEHGKVCISSGKY